MTTQDFEYEIKKDKIRIEAYDKETQRLKNISRKQSSKISNLKKAVLFQAFFFICIFFILFLKGMISFTGDIPPVVLPDNKSDSLVLQNKQLFETNTSLEKSLLLYRDSLNTLSDNNLVKRGEKGYKFRIQIGAFKEVNLEDYSANLVAINQETYDSIFQYTLGKFDEYQKAVEFWEDIKKMGFSDSFILATKNGRRIPLERIPKELKHKH